MCLRRMRAFLAPPLLRLVGREAAKTWTACTERGLAFVGTFDAFALLDRQDGRVRMTSKEAGASPSLVRSCSCISTSWSRHSPLVDDPDASATGSLPLDGLPPSLPAPQMGTVMTREGGMGLHLSPAAVPL